jgi:hypothetical protein
VIARATPQADNEEFGKPGLAAEHPELHHYTTERGLAGILATETIWATHFSDLNDASEVKFMREPLARVLTDRLRRLIITRQNESSSMLIKVQQAGGTEKVATGLARSLVDIMYQITFDSLEFGAPFIASFCSHAADQSYERDHGLLSQWRGYGSAGGYCIVFKTAEIIELLKKEFADFHYTHMNINSARYNHQGDDISSTFSELVNYCELFVSDALDGNRDPSRDDGLGPFLEGATLLKHQGFHEEREVRIVAMPCPKELQARMFQEDRNLVARTIKEVFTLKRNAATTRHISLFETSGRELPISRVIVGPSRDQQTNVAKARELLGPRITISKSETPFIG